MAGRTFNQSDVGTGTGSWIDAGEIDVPYTVEFPNAAAGDTYDIYVSNKEPKPADASDDQKLGATVAAAGIRIITEPYRFIKFKKTAHTTPTQVYLFGLVRR